MTNALPYGGYTRLTQNRYGDKLGHPSQRGHIKRWADSKGVVVGEWYEDDDISAADEDVTRPDYERMLADVRDGKLAGIIVYKIDRLTRLVYEYERAVRLARKSRAIIVSTTGDVTTKTRSGFLHLRREVEHAEEEIVNIRERVTSNKQIRTERGLYHGGGRRPFGFEAPKHDKSGKRVKNTGRVGVKHVKAEVDLIRDAADRIAWKGESYASVIADWHSRQPPVYGATGAPWSTKTLQTLLTSPRMIGKRVYRVTDQDSGDVTETLVDAVWKPVLKKKTWNELVAKVGKANHREGKLSYLLSGLAVCGRCERPLTGALRKYEKAGVLTPTATYRCRSGSADKARGACGRLSVLAEPVEKLVVARVLYRLTQSRGLPGHMASADDVEGRIAELGDQMQECLNDMDVLAKANEDPAVGLRVSEYLAARAPIQARYDSALTERNALLRELDVPHPTGDDWKDLPGWFDALKDSQKRSLVARNVKSVKVLAPGRSGRYFDPARVVVTPADSKKPS